MTARASDKKDGMMTAEYSISKSDNRTHLRFRKQNRNFTRYFPDMADEEPLTGAVLKRLISEAEKKNGKTIDILHAETGGDILLVTGETDDGATDAFAEAFLGALRDFYEANEVHVTRMFGSFVCLKRENGALRAVSATPVPIRYCPLMRQLLTEVGGDNAKRLLSAVGAGEAASQREAMCRLVNEVVIEGGYFDTSRPLNSCQANVLFGASEMMSSAFKSGLLDAAVIVSNNLGTIITTDESNTQGAVKRMTGLFLTSPSKKILETARNAGIVPVFPHTAVIDQPEGVRLAIALGYKRIAVSTAWLDNAGLDEISRLEGGGVTLYRFGLCSTGIDDRTAEAMQKHADIIWSCASKAVRKRIGPNAIAQAGVLIPVHIMTEKGWLLAKNHLEKTAEERFGEPVAYDGVICRRGDEKPVFLNGKDGFHIIPAKELRECADCPSPCV